MSLKIRIKSYCEPLLAGSEWRRSLRSIQPGSKPLTHAVPRLDGNSHPKFKMGDALDVSQIFEAQEPR
jgi:hypothetical protein